MRGSCERRGFRDAFGLWCETKGVGPSLDRDFSNGHQVFVTRSASEVRCFLAYASGYGPRLRVGVGCSLTRRGTVLAYASGYDWSGEPAIRVYGSRRSFAQADGGMLRKPLYWQLVPLIQRGINFSLKRRYLTLSP